MSLTATSESLTRRLVDRYWMFGLGCLFACISLVLVLSWRGMLIQFVPLVVMVPLLLLLVGAVVLRRTVRLTAAIEAQLRNLGAASTTLDSVLRPLAEAEPAAMGWNNLVQQLSEQRTFGALDSRLGEALGSLQHRDWESLFNSLSDGVAVCDRTGIVTAANQSLAALLDLDQPEAIRGHRFADVLMSAAETVSPGFPEGPVAGAATSSHELRRGKETIHGVWRAVRTTLRGGASQSGECLWTLRDITPQKLAEEMRDQFLFAATHELRTPLANIKAYAETLSLQRDIDPEEQKAFLNIINAESTRLARFVDELLDISKMEAGALSVARHELDLVRLVNEVIEHIQPQARQKDLKVETQLPAKMPELKADKDKLAAALVNLLGNAVKYTPQHGEVRLLVEVESTHVLFHVEDKGIGISPEDLPRLFQKFFRSSDDRVQEITGSGLGLAFVQEVARLHGGKVGVHSEMNKGSRFTLSLPLT